MLRNHTFKVYIGDELHEIKHCSREIYCDELLEMLNLNLKHVRLYSDVVRCGIEYKAVDKSGKCKKKDSSTKEKAEQQSLQVDEDGLRKEEEEGKRKEEEEVKRKEEN